MTRLDRHVPIEESVTHYPRSVAFLIEKGLPYLVCGEPTWGTLEELAREKNWDDSAINWLVRELNEYLSTESVS